MSQSTTAWQGLSSDMWRDDGNWTNGVPVNGSDEVVQITGFGTQGTPPYIPTSITDGFSGMMLDLDGANLRFEDVNMGVGARFSLVVEADPANPDTESNLTLMTTVEFGTGATATINGPGLYIAGAGSEAVFENDGVIDVLPQAVSAPPNDFTVASQFINNGLVLDESSFTSGFFAPSTLDGTGTIQLANAVATANFYGVVAAGQTIDFDHTSATVSLRENETGVGLGGFAGSFVNMVGGSSIALWDVGTASIQSYNGSTLVVNTNAGTFSLQASGAISGFQVEGGGSIIGLVAEAACFAAGTRIRRGRDAVAVEALAVGDSVLTAASGLRRVVWIGHRTVDCTGHPRPWDVWPVRVRRGAFGPGVPARDVRLSPDHAVFAADEGVLVPVRYLVNGRTIAQERVERISYSHVELAEHAVIFAEGLPCESYLDTGNRAAFANGGSVARMHPDFARDAWAARACAVLAMGGPVLASVRRRLLDAALAAGHGITEDPGLAVVADGRVVPAEVDGARWHVLLPEGAGSVRLVSRAWVPAHMRGDETDTRSLGVAVSRIWLDGREAGLESRGLGAGWHAPEAGWRWTDGDGRLAVDGVRWLSFDVAMGGRYWHEDAAPCAVSVSERPARRSARRRAGVGR